MPRYTTSQTGIGTSSPVSLNVHGFPFLSFQVDIVGTATYTIESTLNDATGTTLSQPQGINWFPHPVVQNAAAGTQDNYQFKPKHIRINQLSGTGTVYLTVIEPDLSNP